MRILFQTQVRVIHISLSLVITLSLLLALVPHGSVRAYTSPSAGTVLEQQLVLLMSAQEQLANFLSLQTRSGSTLKNGCIDNGISYAHGQTTTSLTLANGQKQSSWGNQFRCDNGFWMFQLVPKTGPSSVARPSAPSTSMAPGSLATPVRTRADFTARQPQCKIGNEIYVSGAIVSGKKLVAASTTSPLASTRGDQGDRISAGTGVSNSAASSTRNRGTSQFRELTNYTCEKGQWKSIPKQAPCFLSITKERIAHGESYSSASRNTRMSTSTWSSLWDGGRTGTSVSNFPRTGENIIRPSFRMGNVKTCVDGQLRENARTCTVGNSLLFHNQESRSSDLIGLYRSSLPTGSRAPGIFTSSGHYLSCSDGQVSLQKNEPTRGGPQGTQPSTGTNGGTQPSTGTNGGTQSSGGGQTYGGPSSGQTSGGSSGQTYGGPASQY